MLSRENLEGLRRRIATQVDVHGVLQKLKAIEIGEVTRRAIDGGKRKVPWRRRRMNREKIPVKRGVASHGDHVAEGSPHQRVVVRKGRAGFSELWFFAACDQHLEDGALQLLQGHLFDQELAGGGVGETREAMREAHAAAAPLGGLATAVLLEREVLVAAGSGGYRAVVSQAGTAVQIGGGRRKRLLNGVPEKLCRAAAAAAAADFYGEKGRPPVAQAERMTSETEMMIIASGGIWEVMGNQEAVDLISHVEDAQEAAKCLADEARARMTKSPVACIVVRFK